MKTQNQIIANLITKVGGQKKVVELAKIPQSRLSEWLHEKHQIRLTVFLELCKKCNINPKELL